MSQFSLPLYKQTAGCQTAFRICYNDPFAVDHIASALIRMIQAQEERYSDLTRAILCIGSDRSTGDALGPLVGACLSKMRLPRTIIWGTLSRPVHALNLESYLHKIEQQKEALLVIAVDASLGKPGHVGLIEVVDGPLLPGAGVNKQLPPVGRYHLSGIVNLGGFMEQMVLQSTRLYHVMEMAEVIARALQKTLLET